MNSKVTLVVTNYCYNNIILLLLCLMTRLKSKQGSLHLFIFVVFITDVH